MDNGIKLEPRAGSVGAKSRWTKAEDETIEKFWKEGKCSSYSIPADMVAVLPGRTVDSIRYRIAKLLGKR